MKFNVQYSKPSEGREAVSAWLEHITIIEAGSDKEAIKKFNETHQHLGTWLILDCWKV